MRKNLYVVLLALIIMLVLPNVYAEPIIVSTASDTTVTSDTDTPETEVGEDGPQQSPEPDSSATTAPEPSETASAAPETQPSSQPLSSAEPSATPDSLYIIDGTHLDSGGIELANYDPTTKEYTATVYLETTRELMTGSIGIMYDPTIAANFSFTLNGDNFETVHNYQGSDCYMAFSWYRKPDAAKEVGTDKYVLGTIKITNVEIGDDGNPIGWHTRTLRQLDWFTTPESGTFNYTEDNGGTCLNDEIFNPDTGWYQGQDVDFLLNSGLAYEDLIGIEGYDNVDIGFVFKSGYDLPVLDKVLISGTVKSYNAKNPLELTLYDDSGEEVTLEPTDITIIDKEDDHGRVVSAYAIYANIVPGDYKIKIAKKVHLTYNKKIVVSGDTASGGVVTLYCGDINADEKIKLNDRASLLNCMNRQNKQNATNFDICDLNGDGKVTMFDLNILKQYFNKSYVEVIPYVQK